MDDQDAGGVGASGDSAGNTEALRLVHSKLSVAEVGGSFEGAADCAHEVVCGVMEGSLCSSVRCTKVVARDWAPWDDGVAGRGGVGFGFGGPLVEISAHHVHTQAVFGTQETHDTEEDLRSYIIEGVVPSHGRCRVRYDSRHFAVGSVSTQLLGN